MTWTCPNARCGDVSNLQTQPACASCQAPRPSSFREALAVLQLPTLEAFLRRAHAKNLTIQAVEVIPMDADLVIRFRVGEPLQRYVFDFAVHENDVTLIGHGERR
jgi:hypothetical protein